LKFLYALLVFVPIAIVARILHWPPIAVFAWLSPAQAGVTAMASASEITVLIIFIFVFIVASLSRASMGTDARFPAMHVSRHGVESSRAVKKLRR